MSGGSKNLYCPKCGVKIGAISKRGNLTMDEHNVAIMGRSAFCRCRQNLDETYENAIALKE